MSLKILPKEKKYRDLSLSYFKMVQVWVGRGKPVQEAERTAMDVMLSNNMPERLVYKLRKVSIPRISFYFRTIVNDLWGSEVNSGEGKATIARGGNGKGAVVMMVMDDGGIIQLPTEQFVRMNPLFVTREVEQRCRTSYKG